MAAASAGGISVGRAKCGDVGEERAEDGRCRSPWCRTGEAQYFLLRMLLTAFALAPQDDVGIGSVTVDPDRGDAYRAASVVSAR